MTTEEKFNAAVNVIRNLPKNGSYQPANDLQLRFYAYYKQATEGPCALPRPNFWEVIKKIKWEAWNKLGNMSRDEAMNNYVEELKKIVETMSYNENVADFLGSLGSFYDHVPMQDLEMLIGDVIERVRSRPGSRDTSPVRAAFSSMEPSPASSYSASPLPPDAPGEDDDEEEFIDTVEAEPERLRHDSVGRKGAPHSHVNGIAALPREHDAHTPHGVGNTCSEQDAKERGRSRLTRSGTRSPERGGQFQPVDLSQKIRETVLHLQRDLDRVTARVRSLEVSAFSGGPAPAPAPVPRLHTSWWPLTELSVQTTVVVIGWPLVVHLLFRWLERRRRQL